MYLYLYFYIYMYVLYMCVDVCVSFLRSGVVGAVGLPSSTFLCLQKRFRPLADCCGVPCRDILKTRQRRNKPFSVRMQALLKKDRQKTTITKI